MPSTSGAAKTASSVNKPLVDRYAPGTHVAVGNQQVEVLNYLAEGGFAQIYSVKYIKYLGEFENGAKAPLQPGDVACLKRVLVPDENGLSEMRNEVEVMKQLRGASAIIQYYDSNASRRTNGGYEVLLLMELCSNNSLLDYMNQRLATKLNEKEILKIMYDTTLAISQMHYLPVPLIHRDIKIENVLVDSKNDFKLCDFGSTSACFPLVTTHQEIAMLTQNIYVNTTPQYRSPEMIDLYRCLPINEKSDIWALGIFLYKLLFFMTPFEMTGQFAILHSKYEFPANNYSSKLINLIIIMLAENPYVRPNIYQVMYHICSVIGCEVPIEDKYGLGPYNFEKYTEFQTKLQNVQYQMFLLQQKKLENNGHLNAVESKLLDNLLITSFEVSSKIPAEFGAQQQPVKPRDVFNSSDEFSDHRKSVFSSRNPSRNPSSASRKNPPSGSEIETESDANTDMEYKQLTAAAMAEKESQSHFNLPHQKSVSSYSSGKSSSGGPPSQDLKSSDALVGEQTAKSEQSPGVIKQHKSNNPFPMMAQGLAQPNQPIPLSTAADTPAASAPTPPAGHVPPLAVPPVPVPAPGHGVQSAHAPGSVQIPSVGARGTPISVQPEIGNRPEYFMDANASPDDQKFKLSQPVPVPQAQAQPRMDFNQTMFYQHADSPIPVHGQMQPIAFNNVPDVSQAQSHVRYNYPVPQPQQQSQPGSSSYYPSPPIGPKASLSSQNPLPPPQQLSQQRPRPIPAQNPSQQHFAPVSHQQQQQQQQQQQIEQMKQQPQHATTIGTIDISQPPENPPPKPPHPKTWQDYHVHEGSDFKQSIHRRGGSDHKSKKESSVLEKPVNRNLDLSYNELDLNADDPLQRSSHIRHEASTSSDSSESIDIDLDDARKDRIHQQNPRKSQSQSQQQQPQQPQQQRQQHPSGNEILTHQSEIPFRQRLNSSSGSLRRSLDLKYQEVNFSSPESEKTATRDATKRSDMRSHAESRRYSNNSLHNRNPNVTSGIASNEADVGSTLPPSESPSQNHGDLEKYRDGRKNSSNSSVNASAGAGVGGSSGGPASEVRRSFAKARQSLDLEKVRREALKGEAAIAGKRRSLFSVFKGNDKK